MTWFLAYNRSPSPLTVSTAGRMVDGNEFTYADDADRVVQLALIGRILLPVPITFNPETASSPPVDREALLAAREVVSRNGGGWTPTPSVWLPDWPELTSAVAELLDWYHGGGGGGGGPVAPGGSTLTAVASQLGPMYAALARRGVDTAKVVVLGSADAAGVGASDPGLSWAGLAAARLQSAYPSGGAVEPPVQTLAEAAASPFTGAGVQVINGAAAGGASSATYVGPVTLNALAAVDADVVVHMIGAEDSTEGMSYVAAPLFEANLRAALDSIDAQNVEPGTPVTHILVHGPRRGGVSASSWAQYLAAMRRVEQERRTVAVVDLSGVFETARHLGGDPFDLIAADLVSLTDAGHWVVAESLSRALRLAGGGSGGGGASDAESVTWAPVAAPETTVAAALAALTQGVDASASAAAAVAGDVTTLSGVVAGKVAAVETREVPAPPRKVLLTYPVAATDPNISEVRINDVTTSWHNEWGALRGRNPYTGYADALVRAIVEAGDYVGFGGTAGCAFEIVDRNVPEGPGRLRWGRRWQTGVLVRNGYNMVDTWIRETPETPIPADLPANTVVRTLGVLGG